ncbi:Transposase [Rhodovulum sp. ES.010]|nr:Transposase [Rhodovulum sp. ES.010]
MKRKRFSEEKIIGVLKEHEAGAKVDDICRRHAISTATFYNEPLVRETMANAQADHGRSDAGHDRDEGALGKKLVRVSHRVAMRSRPMANGEAQSRGLSDQ